MIKGVVFDLDGTLIDSMSVWHNIDIDFLKENGVDNPPENISDIMKKLTVDEASQYFIDNFGLDLTPGYITKRIEEMVRIQYEQLIALKPYVIETLDYLDSLGIPYGVATATYKNLAEAVMKRCGIYDRMKFLVTEIEYPNGKTFPDIFLGCADRLGCKPCGTLVIEDSLHCIETASKAEFITAAVYDDASLCDMAEIKKTADYYWNSLDELKSALR